MSENKETALLDYSLSNFIEKRLEKYFLMHKGEEIPHGLYNRIINETEKSLFKATLLYTKGNQSKASKILGINRNTLKKKLINLKISFKE